LPRAGGLAPPFPAGLLGVRRRRRVGRGVSLSRPTGLALGFPWRRSRHVVGRHSRGVRQRHHEGSRSMGKGNNSQKNDKKNKKPKQEKPKAAPKK
jgi:hypothetical protein